MPLNVQYIILHCTDGPWGTVESIRKFHTDPPPAGRGWLDIGYHYVLTNPYSDSTRIGRPDVNLDGKVWKGRDLDHDGNVEEEIGAHVHGWNHISLGVALVGKRIRDKEGHVLGSTFTSAQIVESARLIRELCVRHQVSFSSVLGHYEVPGVAKTCPDIDMSWYRDYLRTG